VGNVVPLTRTELRLAAALLKMAQDKFSNHGCGDFAWPAWFPKEERYPFALGLYLDLCGPREAEELARESADSRHAPTDWELMLHLSKRLAADATAEPANPWRKVADDPPPVDEMVLLCWHGLEGSAVGYRFVNEGDSYYCVGGDTSDGDDPEWWMPVPELP
jgi:hypothetical protein